MEVIGEISAAQGADDEGREVTMSPDRKRQSRQSKKGKALKEVEDDTFVLPKCAESSRRPNRREEREAARRSDSRDESTHGANAVERDHAGTMR